MKKKGKGFTLVEIMIVVAIIGLLAAIAIPSFMRARTSSQRNACINNMRQISAAKDQYALETGRTNLWNWAAGGGMSVNEVALTDLCEVRGGYIRVFPLCPASTTTVLSAEQSSFNYQVSPISSNVLCNVLHSSDAHALQGTF